MFVVYMFRVAKRKKERKISKNVVTIERFTSSTHNHTNCLKNRKIEKKKVTEERKKEKKREKHYSQ